MSMLKELGFALSLQQALFEVVHGILVGDQLGTSKCCEPSAADL